MNLSLSRDEFHDLIMTYIIELSMTQGKMMRTALLFILLCLIVSLNIFHDRPLGDLKFAYERQGPKNKLNFNRMIGKIQNTNNITGISMPAISERQVNISIYVYVC